MFIIRYIAILIGIYQVVQSGQLASFLYNNIWITTINLLIELLVNLYIAMEYPVLILLVEILNNPIIGYGINHLFHFMNRCINYVKNYCKNMVQ